MTRHEWYALAEPFADAVVADENDLTAGLVAADLMDESAGGADDFLDDSVRGRFRAFAAGPPSDARTAHLLWLLNYSYRCPLCKPPLLGVECLACGGRRHLPIPAQCADFDRLVTAEATLAVGTPEAAAFFRSIDGDGGGELPPAVLRGWTFGYAVAPGWPGPGVPLVRAECAVGRVTTTRVHSVLWGVTVWPDRPVSGEWPTVWSDQVSFVIAGNYLLDRHGRIAARSNFRSPSWCRRNEADMIGVRIDVGHP